MRPPSSARGFTLIELMTSVVVVVLVLAAVAATFAAVQRTYQLQSQVKSAVEGSRGASAYLERVVRLAGYGIDPALAFDFKTGAPVNLPGNTKDNYAGAGFTTDDLAFRYRDPAYLRRGSMAGNNALTLDAGATFDVPLRVGQRLFLMCRGARQYYVAVVGAPVAANATTASVAPSTTAPFNVAPYNVAPPCMQSVSGLNAAYVMLLREERVRVVSLGNRPYLVVFHNLASPDPLVNTDFDPVAADVENFQVAYVMNRPIPGGLYTATPSVDQGSTGSQNPNWVMGDEGSVAGEIIPDDSLAAPTYDMGYDSPQRYTKHPANIRAVRMTAVVRSTRALAGRQATGVRPFNVENWTAPAAPDGFYRTPSVTTVRVPNMTSRSTFNPMIRETAADDPELNRGGS